MRRTVWTSEKKHQRRRDDALRTTLYQVHPGDDLPSISMQVYGRRDFWVFIFIANPGEIHGLKGLRAGKLLRIPVLPEDGETRPAELASELRDAHAADPVA